MKQAISAALLFLILMAIFHAAWIARGVLINHSTACRIIDNGGHCYHEQTDTLYIIDREPYSKLPEDQ